MNAETFSQQLRAHRSIRRYKDLALDPNLMDRLLIEALQGTSSSGNLNLVSVVKTQDPARKRACARAARRAAHGAAGAAGADLLRRQPSARASGWRSAARGWALPTW
jgi:hypothetical protein